MHPYTAADTLRIAKRYNNPKRSYLLVNPLQAKHIPVSPAAALEMMGALGDQVAAKYPEARLVIGFAETATAIGAAAQDENLVILNFSGTDGDFQFASEAERAENVNIGISVRKGNTVLKDAIDSVLSTMTEDDFNQLMDEAIRVQPEV